MKNNKLILGSVFSLLIIAGFVMAVVDYSVSADGEWLAGPCKVDFDFYLDNVGEDITAHGWTLVLREFNGTNETLYNQSFTLNATNETILVDSWETIDNTAGDKYYGIIETYLPTFEAGGAIVEPQDKKFCSSGGFP